MRLQACLRRHATGTLRNGHAGAVCNREDHSVLIRGDAECGSVCVRAQLHACTGSELRNQEHGRMSVWDGLACTALGRGPPQGSTTSALVDSGARSGRSSHQESAWVALCGCCLASCVHAGPIGVIIGVHVGRD